MVQTTVWQHVILLMAVCLTIVPELAELGVKRSARVRELLVTFFERIVCVMAVDATILAIPNDSAPFFEGVFVWSFQLWQLRVVSSDQANMGYSRLTDGLMLCSCGYFPSLSESLFSLCETLWHSLPCPYPVGDL